MAQRLLLMTKTSGRRHTPAMLSASATSPFEVAPSPKTQTATRFSRLSLNASATPTACGAWVADRYADRKILARLGKIAAPLVAAPEKEELDQADPAPQLGAVLAEARQKHVLLPHRAGDPDGHRLLTQRRGKGAEPAGPLKGDRLGIEAASQHHRPVEGD